MSSLVKNTTFMTLSSVGQKIIAFVYFAIIARMVGVEGTGKYFIALSFTTILAVFVDLGFTNVLVREVAKYKDRAQKYLSTVLSVKLLFAGATYLFLIFLVQALGYDVEMRHLIYLSGLTMIFDSIHLSLYGTLRSLGNLKFEALSLSLSQLLSLFLGTTFLLLQLPLIFLILAFTIPSFLNVCFATFFLKRRYQIVFRPSFDRALFLLLASMAWPFALSAIFARVYSYIDSILLERLSGEVAAGLYAIPYKITYAFQFIPLALVASLYPRFSEHFAQNKDKLPGLLADSTKYLSLIAFPIAFGVATLAPDIITSVFSAEYTAAISTLRILIFGLLFSFLSFPLGAFLNACDRQATQTKIIGGVMLVNIVLNLIFIPLWQTNGAATAALVGNVLLVLFGAGVATRVVTLPWRWFASLFFRLLVASLIMSAVAWWVNMFVHFVVAIFVAALVYGCMIVALKLFVRTDWLRLKQGFLS